MVNFQDEFSHCSHHRATALQFDHALYASLSHATKLRQMHEQVLVSREYIMKTSSGTSKGISTSEIWREEQSPMELA
jgi:hypothetical protein